MKPLFPWLLSLVALCASGQVVITLGLMGGGAVLDDTNLVWQAYVDEAASGTGPTDVLDSGPATTTDLPITYGGSLAYTEVSGNRGLECTATTGNQRAQYVIDDTTDKIRDANGGTKYTMCVMFDIDACNSGPGRMLVINGNGGQNPAMGFTCSSATSMSVWWEETARRTIDPGTTKAFWCVVYDTTQVTANDRVKLYKDGVVQSPTVDSNPALNDTFGYTGDHSLIAFNRQSGGGYSRSVDGIWYYGDYWDDALSASRISDNYDILSLDDDTP